jgi:hypothetical protein
VRSIGRGPGGQESRTCARRHAGGARGLAVLLAAAALASGCASQSGKATEGAIEALRETPPPGTVTLAERVGGDTTEGVLGKLASPEGLASVAQIVDATVAQSLAAALRPPPVAGRRGGPGASRSLLGRAGHDTGAGFADALASSLEAALGPDGQGPLAASLGATASELSSSIARGVRDELGGSLFVGCALADHACMEAEVRSLGRAASAGFVEGLVATVAWPALAIAFALGVLAALLVRGVFGHERRHPPPERREAHP